jgi:hypothetical protein
MSQLITNNNSPNKNEKVKTAKCDNCNGYGQVEVKVIRCLVCSTLGIFGCINCKSGYLSEPYIECTKCDGRGTISLSE